MPLIYTDNNTWATLLGDPNFSSHPLWIANYASGPKPLVPKSWGDGNWLFWQYHDTISGVIPGASGADLDRFHVLASGAKNSEVKRVQQWLHDTSAKRKDAALDPGSVSGTYDAKTEAAVKRLQAIDVNPSGSHNANLGPLPATGVVDVVTWAKLLRA